MDKWEIFEPTTYEKEVENKEDMVRRISIMYSIDYITDDNPSKINNYTGLSQVLIYSLGLEDELDLMELEDDVYAFSQKGEDFHFCIKDIPKNSFKEKILTMKLAQGYFRKILTDDTPSRWNHLSGLDQAICFEFGPIPLDEIERIKKDIVEMRPHLFGGVTSFEG